MKRTIAILSLFIALVVPLVAPPVHAGPVFTYQGLFVSNGTPVVGPVELMFKFYDASNGGTLLATTDYPSVNLAGGIFTQEIDLGSNLNTVLTGADRWIEITDVTHSTTLPRQHLTWSPYAILANSAAMVSANSINSSNIAPGQAVKSFNGLTDNVSLASGANVTLTTNSNTITISSTGGGGGGSAWNLTGNSGTTPGANFVGTTDNQALELDVNNSRALRLEPNANGSPNVIGGSPQNSVMPGVTGSTIAGGGSNGLPNSISGQYGFIGGGLGNTVAGTGSVVLGGGLDGTSVAGNTNLANASVTGGGIGNFVATGSDYTTMNGGFHNVVGALSPYSTIGGGGSNTIMVSNIASVITGGFHNSVGTNAEAGSIVGGAFNSIGNSSLPIGFVFGATIDGGDHNQIQDGAAGSTIVGGEFNIVQSNATDSVIGGGLENTVIGATGTIAGGLLNVAGPQAFAAGTQAQANHLGSFVWADAQGGVFADTTNNQFLIRSGGGVAINTNNPNGSALFVNGTVTAAHFVGDGSGLSNISATIPPGSITAAQIGSNQVVKTLNGLTDAVSLAAGSNVNLAISSNVITISSAGGSGGGSNSGVQSVTAALPLTSSGGQNPVISLSNTIPSTLLAADVVLEDTNNAFINSNNFAGVVVATNLSNAISGTFTGDGSGLTNLNVPGGTVTSIATGAGLTGGPITISGTISIGAGSVSNAMLQHPSLTVTAGTGLSGGGSVALGASITLAVSNVLDTSLSTNIPRLNATTNSFSGTNLFAHVGVGTGTSNVTHLLQVGTVNPPAFCDGTTWQNSSDRDVKQDFAAVDAREILQKVAAMSITEWTYKSTIDTGRHLGPMAQDFHEAFGLNGDDDRHISTVDESGVALAAIQGLNEKMEVLRAENNRLRQQNETISRQLSEVQAAVKAMQARN